MNNLKNKFVLFAIVGLSACTVAAFKPLRETDWQITSYRCVFQCVDVTEQFFKPYLGKILLLSGQGVSDPYFGTCSREDFIVTLEEVSTDSLLKERSKQLPEGMRFTRENTGIKTEKVHAGEIACKDPQFGKRTILSVLSANEHQILALEEDGLLLVLEPVPSR